MEKRGEKDQGHYQKLLQIKAVGGEGHIPKLYMGKCWVVTTQFRTLNKPSAQEAEKAAPAGGGRVSRERKQGSPLSLSSDPFSPEGWSHFFTHYSTNSLPSAVNGKFFECRTKPCCFFS